MQPRSTPLALEQRITRLAGRQKGQISRIQLLDLGLGAGAIKHRLRTGRLQPSRHSGVYSLGVAPLTRERRWAAALLACGTGAVLSHLSAAALWVLRSVDPVTIDISVPHRAKRRHEGIRVHRPRQLASEDVERHCGIPVTTVARTLIDLAEVLSTRALERALDEGEFLEIFDRNELQVALARNAGRNGASRLAKLLTRHEPGTTRTMSELEEDFFDLVMAAGLPQPEVNQPFGPYTPDFLWREHKLVVETDGGASHDRPSQRERDARRDAWFAARGYETLRFTWEQVHQYTDEVIAAVSARLVHHSPL